MDVTSATMGKDEFLKLFCYQLQNQDPMSPMDSSAFTAELAQFSQIEQLYNINDTLEAMLGYQASLNNGLSTNLIGRTVTWTDGVTDTTDVVTGINFDDGATYLLTAGGDKVLLSQIKEILASES